MDRRTVVHVLAYRPQGDRSMDRFLRALTVRLQQAGWRSVFVFSGAPDTMFRRWLADTNSPYLVVQFPLSISSAARLAYRLRPYKPAVVLTRYVSPFNLGIWCLKGMLGSASWVHVDASSTSASNKRGIRRALAHARSGLVSHLTKEIIAVSGFVARRNIEQSFLPSARVRLCYNGVDTHAFRPARAGPPRKVLTVVFAGQLERAKGVLLLLKAVRDLAAEGLEPFQVLIAGVGSQSDELKTFCRFHALGCVEFLGHVDRMPELLAAADIVVVPSMWEEAFGFVVAEAMACGTVVLASDAGGIPELIGPSGTAGVTFHRGDVTDLTDKLRNLIESPELRKHVGCHARARAVLRFGLDRMVAEYEETILRCAQNGSCRAAPETR